MSLKDADEEQGKLVNELMSLDKGREPILKRPFLNKEGLFVCSRDKKSSITLKAKYFE